MQFWSNHWKIIKVDFQFYNFKSILVCSYSSKHFYYFLAVPKVISDCFLKHPWGVHMFRQLVFVLFFVWTILQKTLPLRYFQFWPLSSVADLRCCFPVSSSDLKLEQLSPCTFVAPSWPGLWYRQNSSPRCGWSLHGVGTRQLLN